jgi:hypothetical protein
MLGKALLFSLLATTTASAAPTDSLTLVLNLPVRAHPELLGHDRPAPVPDADRVLPDHAGRVEPELGAAR